MDLLDRFSGFESTSRRPIVVTEIYRSAAGRQSLADVEDIGEFPPRGIAKPQAKPNLTDFFEETLGLRLLTSEAETWVHSTPFENLSVLEPYITASVKMRESHEAHCPLVYLAPSHKLSQQFRGLYATLDGPR